MDNTFASMIRQSLNDAHTTLEDTMKGVDNTIAHYKPAGKALPIIVAYAHVAISEDILLNSWALKKKSLLESEWASKTGLSVPHPAMDQDWEKNYTEWTKIVKADMPKLQAYAHAVYENSDAVLAKLTDRDMVDMKVDLSAWGMGEWPMARYVIRFLIGHVDSLCGEISAAKGLQDLKGYPF
ncbi:DinB family protein [Candidatus Microgenomates bacterium]|nr:DinB family protein [Candidatus Microgenomates bacterium]